MASAVMYSIPEQAKKLFEDGILSNPLVSRDLPDKAQEYGKKIKFQGNDAPSLPINWRFAESISAIKALEATMILALLDDKYNVQPKEITINTSVVLFWFYNDL